MAKTTLKSQARLSNYFSNCRICLEKPRKGAYGTFCENTTVSKSVEEMFFDMTGIKVNFAVLILTKN